MSRTVYPFPNVTFRGTYVGDPAKTGDLLIEVDWVALAKHIGSKAANNRTGKARTLHGAIIAKFKEAKE
jgi:hypothetical protein